MELAGKARCAALSTARIRVPASGARLLRTAVGAFVARRAFEAARGAAKPGASGGGANNRYFAQVGAVGQQNIRFVSGKSFYQNDSCWIDSEVQNQKAGAQKVRIKFGSSDYFKLLREKPAALKWISLGKHVEFVLDGNHYEIYQETKNENN